MTQPGTFGQPSHDKPWPESYEDVEDVYFPKQQEMNFGGASALSKAYDDFNTSKQDPIDYKFNEDKIIDELQKYIDSTYEGHYSKNKFQSMEFIVDCGHGDSFCLGNIIKYAQRYGKKDGKNRKDLLKIMHYAIIALSVLDDELNGENDNEDM